MEANDGSRLLGRRYALRLLGVGLAAGGVLALEACGKSSGPSQGGGAAGGGQDCNSTIDDQSRTMRRTLQYNDVAAVPEKHCGACVQYDATKYGTCGGGCKLFAGPVKEGGGCLSFAPKAGAAGSAKPT
jgi:hypothetical protein